MKTTLDCIEINPPSPAIGSVIWLHGLGADGNDFVPIVPEINLPLRYVFPNAPMQPVTINNGYVMRAWYDIYSLTSNHRADQNGIEVSVKLLNELIEREKQNGFSSDKIVLAGFSQGAVIALTTGLQYTQTLGGILALSGYIPDVEKTFSAAKSANQSTPIFIAHGMDDTVVPYALGLQVYDELQKRQYAVAWHRYAMAHSVCGEEIRDITGWLSKIFM